MSAASGADPAPVTEAIPTAGNLPTSATGRPRRTRVMLLGAGELGRELVIALQRLGAEVIAADRYADAPLHGIADQSVVVDMTDAEELGATIDWLQPRFVVAATDLVAADALAAAGETGVTEVVPSIQGARFTTDREGLRRLAADELGLPTAPFWIAGSADELAAVAEHAGFPLVVKPVSAPRGEGESVLLHPDDVEPAWQHATAGDDAERSGAEERRGLVAGDDAERSGAEERRGLVAGDDAERSDAEERRGLVAGDDAERSGDTRVLVETLVQADYEVTLPTVRSEGPGGPTLDFCAPIGHRSLGGDGQLVLESWQPQPMSVAALEAARSIAARIVRALGGRGLFGVELLVRDDEVYFSDVTARPYDITLLTRRTQRLSGLELQARAILGLASDTIMISPGAARLVCSGRVAHRAPAAGSESADVVADALRVPESDVVMFGHAEGYPRRRLGAAVATGADVATARERAGRAAAVLATLWPS